MLSTRILNSFLKVPIKWCQTKLKLNVRHCGDNSTLIGDPLQIYKTFSIIRNGGPKMVSHIYLKNVNILSNPLFLIQHVSDCIKKFPQFFAALENIDQTQLDFSFLRCCVYASKVFHLLWMNLSIFVKCYWFNLSSYHRESISWTNCSPNFDR